jgi:hypothetical protein
LKSRLLLLQLILHFVDAGIDAGLVDPGRAGEGNSANIIAYLDRHAADGDDMGQGGLRRRTGSVSMPLKNSSVVMRKVRAV